MFDALLESVLPGGVYLALGLALGAAFSRQLRPVAKEAMKVGMSFAARAEEVAAEAYERGQDLVAEARYEYEQENGDNGSQPRRAAPRRRRTVTAAKG
jgi:hypothetical protein